MNKIKSLRMGTGMSQEELAEKTGLSLRTIQRIENGETRARGDSLRRLCQALEVPMEEVLRESSAKEGTGKEVSSLEENRGFLVLLNLSALAFLVSVPGLGVAAPLVLWLLYRDKIAGVREMGLRILNFQITWLLVVTTLYVTVFLLEFNHIFLPAWLTWSRFMLITLVLYAFNINCIVVNSIRAHRKRLTNYAPAIPFVRLRSDLSRV